MFADLVGGQRHPVHLEVQVLEESDLEGLELAGHADRHLPAGRVAVGEVQHHHRPAVLCADLSHPVQHRVGRLAGGQVQVRLVPPGDRAEHVLQRRLLADEHQLVRLHAAEPAAVYRLPIPGHDPRLDLADVRDVDVDAYGDVRLVIGRRPQPDLRCRVALVDDLVEGDVAEPPGRLPGAFR